MLRRFFIFLCIFSILFSFLVFSVSASALDSFQVSLDNSNSYNPFSKNISFFPTPGSYRVSYSAVVPGIGSVSESFVSSLTTIIDNDVTLLVMPFSVFGMNAILVFADMNQDFYLVQIKDLNGNTPLLPSGSSIIFEFDKILQDSFEVSSSNGLFTSINWVNTVVTSIVNNGLWQIAAIPISIALLLCAAKVIKSNSWGL